MITKLKAIAKAILDHLLNVCMWLEEEEYGERKER